MAEGCLLMSSDERERSHLIRATVAKQLEPIKKRGQAVGSAPPETA